MIAEIIYMYTGHGMKKGELIHLLFSGLGLEHRASSVLGKHSAFAL